MLKCFIIVLSFSTARTMNLFSIKIGNTDLLERVLKNLPDIKINNDAKNFVKSNLDPNLNEDSFLKTPDLVLKYGYPSETHSVITEDGYILKMHRIARPGAFPVLLTHGLMDSSATWVMMGPTKGLGYLLYDGGYDVWMMNVRGNTYSRNHRKLSTKGDAFWDFSFHEIGFYDLPASIDYVLKKTNSTKLHYIGHSQGTTSFWIMASERPEYTKKILLMQALAPVAYMEHCQSPVINFMSMIQTTIGMVFNLFGVKEFLPDNEFLGRFNQILCQDHLTKAICMNIVFQMSGFDRKQFNDTMLPVILGHMPAGASVKQIKHFGQLKRSGKFCQYDYGSYHNKLRYKSNVPPGYKLENVKCKVALYYSKNDWLAAVRDVERLAKRLPNVVYKFLVEYDDFNHLDFIIAINAEKLLWHRLFEVMRKVEAKQL